MSLSLHATYSIDNAIAGLGGRGTSLCDDQFVVLHDAVLCFVTLANSTEGSQVPSPSEVVWKPERLDYAPMDEVTWLPRDVREVFDRSGREVRRLRRHHVFVRSTDMQEFVYAGEAHLGSYGGPSGNGTGNREALFTLNTKLPRETWIRCGGYLGWQIDVNHQEPVMTDSDLNTFDELVVHLNNQDYSHLVMTRYEEDSLTIYTNPVRAWLMYLREPDDCGLYLNDPLLGDYEEHFECVCGISLDFPARQTVSHSQAIQIAREFFQTGTLPSDVTWNEE